MTNLVLTQQWDDIYQIEKNDPVIGGLNGIANRQAEQLGNRTEWLKATLDSILTAADIDTANPDNEKLLQAIKILIAQSTNQFTSFLDSMIGNPIAHNSAELPVLNIPGYTYLFMSGNTFNTALYPKLAKRYPTGKLPDMRANVVRGLDNGRGIDSSRKLLTEQLDEIKSHFHYLMTKSGGGYVAEEKSIAVFDDSSAINSGAITNLQNSSNYYIKDNVTLQTYNTGGDETRMRNIAFNYICLAA